MLLSHISSVWNKNLLEDYSVRTLQRYKKIYNQELLIMELKQQLLDQGLENFFL